jgi:type IV pilus assembly protein PilY1
MNIRTESTFQNWSRSTGVLGTLARAANGMTSRKRFKLHASLLGIITAATVSFFAFGQSSPPNIPTIALSSDPLYTPSAVDKPVLALALSVEYPTVGAQYVDPDNNGTSDDPTYSPTNEYLGYYDAESCYTYDNAGTGAPSGQTSDYKRFVRRGKAIALATPDTANPLKTTRMCWNGTKSYTKDDGTFSTTTNDGFSGNFLNWASNSAIDMLRLALTGGDRVVDTASLTILQRAIIPNGDPISMGNSNNFPSKRLYASGTSRAITSANFASPSYVSGVPYFGAIPKSMATDAGGVDVYVANALNRIYFGTSKTGNNTGGFGSYTLGGAATSPMGPVVYSTAALPGTAVACTTGENQTCSFSGIKEVWYGAPNKWNVFPASDGADCSNAAIGDPFPGQGKKCYITAYAGAWTPPATTNLNNNGFFYARVQVCDRDPSTYVLKDIRYWGFCSKYQEASNNTNPIYKPTGTVQKYADQLRLAAFGYVMDQTASYSAGRYGGVLRAPVKYVGARTFDSSGFENTPSGGNPNQEWDPVTGIFYPNPNSNSTVATADGRGVYLSGVTSYLNQFGRTGSVAGRYKKYDPIGELHYETLRYLQGLQPSSDAVSGLTTDMYDGYPVYTTWTDPYAGRPTTSDYSCLKSNIVVIGDKNTHDGNRLPTASVANNIPDISEWRTVVKKFENNATYNYVDGQGITRSTGNPNGANNSVPTSTQTSQIMGSAYWARTHDVRPATWSGSPTKQMPGLRVKTFMFDVNEYGGSNDANTRRTSNQLFLAAKYGGFETDPANTAKNEYNTRGNPFVSEADGTNNNYVWADKDTRTSRVGEANTYFLQSDARGVLSAFDDIFARASTTARSISGTAIQSKNLTQGDTVYQGQFDTTDWVGDLIATPLDVSVSNDVTIGTTYKWTAATQLKALISPATTRKIFVGNRGAIANPVAAPFLWATPAGSAGIETSLRTDLDKPAPASAADGYAQRRLNFLRGDPIDEGSVFRRRRFLLGDIVNSGVAYSGAPNTSIQGSTYASFYNTYKTRTAAVFVGANDGMMHAFNAETGNELFGYIPSWLGPKLSALTSTSYANNHQSYVDGTPTVGEALVGSTGTSADWKTVLVSGTGAGGRGVFALDVTDPATFTAANAMWEFTQVDDPDMGYVVGKPQILKMRTSAPGSTATYKYFAVVASGVDNYANDGAGNFSTTGQPALFFLDLAKPAGTAWQLGTNYYKVSFPVDATLALTKPTGMLNFRIVVGSSREVTQIFAGDLHGNLWKLDFSLYGTADWNITKLSYFKKGSSAPLTPYPMFIAKDGSGNIQPISAAPSLVAGTTADTTYVVFGTGKYLEVSDKSNTAVQSVYMVYDNASGSADSSPAGSSAISGRARLKAGTATTTATTVPAFTVGRAPTDAAAIRSGWYFDLPLSKERQIYDGVPLVNSNIVSFNSLVPGASTASGNCTSAGGFGRAFNVDALSGVGTVTDSNVGILGAPLIANLVGATLYSQSDSTGRRTKTIVSQVLQQGSDGLSAGSKVSRQITVGRLSWRQIYNYQDLKNTP